MDLTSQVPVQYCSLQHRTLLPSPGCCFCFGSISSFFMELFLHWAPVAYWAPTNLGSSSFSLLSFCLFLLFMGFSRQEYWSVLPFPPPMDHILSELSTMTCPSCVALHGMAHSFIELDKAVLHWSGSCKVLGWFLGDTPCPSVKEKSSKMVRGVNSHLDSNPIPANDAQGAQTNLVHTRTQGPHRDWDRTVFEHLLWRYRSAVDCHGDGALGAVDLGMAKASWRRLPLTPP